MILLAIIIFVLLSYVKSKETRYTKAVCQINGEELEIKIKDIKTLENGEYKITDQDDGKWILSSKFCTFTEE